jgi:hypothetical protein
MSLDISRLEKARQCGGKTISRCPACAEDGNDEKGEHLVIMPDGRFGCVAHPGAAGKSHRQRIFAMAGEAHARTRGACMVRVRRPTTSNLQQIAGLLDGIGRFGRVSATYARTREQNTVHACEIQIDMFTHTRESEKTPSKPSSPSNFVRTHTRQAPPPECGDPLMAKALATFNSPRQADSVAKDIDPQTGYPIINGAICPF